MNISETNKIDISIRCPVKGCKQIKQKITVSNEIILGSRSGITSISIPEGIVCEHSFIAYIDNNFKIRDVMTCDFKIEMPLVDFIDYEVKKDVSYDADLIKLNLNPSTISILIKCIFSDINIVYFSETEHLNNHYNDFFQDITKDSFNNEITFIPLKLYQSKKNYFKKNNFKKFSKVINDKKMGSSKNLKIENLIVKNFFQDRNIVSSVLRFKNEFSKAYYMGEFISKSVPKNRDKINILTIEQKLKEKFNVDVKLEYMEFLFKISENIFNIPVKYFNNLQNFLF